MSVLVHLDICVYCVCYPRNNVDLQMQASVRLQNALNNIADTSLSWNLKLNPAKCVITRFGEKSVTDQVAYSIYGTNLFFVDSFRNIGITIDSVNKFHAYINAAKHSMWFCVTYVYLECFSYSSIYGIRKLCLECWLPRK